MQISGIYQTIANILLCYLSIGILWNEVAQAILRNIHDDQPRGHWKILIVKCRYMVLLWPLHLLGMIR